MHIVFSFTFLIWPTFRNVLQISFKKKKGKQNRKKTTLINKIKYIKIKLQYIMSPRSPIAPKDPFQGS